MMEVVAPNLEETRLPPVVVNGHCKLKQNGVVKCQETGMTEPELCRRPSPEGEESCVVSEITENSSSEKQDLPLKERDFQREREEMVMQKDKEDSLKKEKEERKLEAEKIFENGSEEVKEVIDSNKTLEEANTPLENNNEEKENISLESKTTNNEKAIVPEIEITTCGENQIDEETEAEIQKDEVCEEKKEKQKDEICAEKKDQQKDEICAEKKEQQKDEIFTEMKEQKEEVHVEKTDKNDNAYVESVLDREIRLQQEREESLSKEREAAKIQSGISEPRVESHQKPISIQLQSTERPYCSQTTESRIALEIREMREREEELRKMRENIKTQTIEVSETKEVVTTEKEQPIVPEKKPPINETLPPNLGMFKKRDRIKVRPLEDVEDEDKPIYRMSKESPIEREIRLLKEREEELRREKGLNVPPKKSETSSKVIKEKTSTSITQNGDTQRLLATNRIQQEIEEQTKRELDLRETGHIRTISRDTAERPVNGSICKSAKFLNCSGKENINNGIKGENCIESKSSTEKKNKVDARFPLINRRNVSAESKIQQELLEMKAREEELRQQRLKISDQSLPDPSVLVNGNGRDNSPECFTSHLNLKDQNKIIDNDAPVSGRRRRSALIAQWEQRIQNAEGKS